MTDTEYTVKGIHNDGRETIVSTWDNRETAELEADELNQSDSAYGWTYIVAEASALTDPAMISYTLNSLEVMLRHLDNALVIITEEAQIHPTQALDTANEQISKVTETLRDDIATKRILIV